jgi:uroporphyrinogen decarboxylase
MLEAAVAHALNGPFLRAAWGESTPRAPIWIMRQAGRYLPEYRALKERSSFLEMVRTPALAAEITLQPIKRFPLDAAIVFSDIMTPLEALGIEIAFSPGPHVAEPLRSAARIAALRTPEDGEIAPFVGEALRLVRADLPADVALIGFAGAPLTLAAYLVEGSGSKEYERFRAFLRAEPAALHVLLEKLTGLTIAYLKMQIASGAQAVQLFDSWAGLHDLPTYREFAIPYYARILNALEGSGAARIFFALGASHLAEAIAELPCEVVGVDWRTDLRAARATFGRRALQGNLDPAVLFADAPELERETHRILEAGRGGAHIFNLGHGIWPAVSPDAVAHLVEVVHGYERE